MNSNISQASENILYIRFYHISGAHFLHNFVTENLGMRVTQPTTSVHHRIYHCLIYLWKLKHNEREEFEIFISLYLFPADILSLQSVMKK